MQSIYHALPLISSILVACLGVFVFLKYFSNKNELHLILGLFCFAITIWLFGTYMMFQSPTTAGAVFWDRVVYGGVVFTPVFMFHFAVAYADVKKLRPILKYLYPINFIFLILSQTQYFVNGIYYYKWGVHTKAQFFHHIFLVYMIAFTLPFFPIVWRYYKSTQSKLIKKQARLVLLAFGILYSLGMCAFLPAYGIPIPPFPFVSGGLFIVILSYAILKHKLLSIKAAGAVLLTFILLIVLFAEIFFAKTSLEIVMRILAFLVMATVGYFLLRNVENEVDHLERIEKLVNKLERDKKQLEELDRMKDEFLQMATHELNTPITVIQGRLSMALDDNMAQLNQKQREFFAPVLIDAQRLAHLSKDLLNVTRIDQNRLKLEKTDVDLDALIVHIVSDMQIRAKEQKNTIQYRSNEKLPHITADQSKISEVITNLVTNANKFTKDGTITVTAEVEDGVITVAVKDTGIGIPEDDQPHLFEKFYQAGRFDPNNPQEQQGSGLGLYISKSIIELHGGKMWLESKKDHGSTFYFSLPVANTKRSEHASNQLKPKTATSSS